MRPRKSRDHRMASRVPATASMGPRPCGRGNEIPVLVLACDRGGFNGAAALRPRKCYSGNTLGVQAAKASMGPRPCGRGNRGLWLWTPANRLRFNGAAALRPRKLGTPMTASPRSPWLQWGRGLAAVEMRWCIRVDAVGSCASMGPRPCGRGNSRRAESVAMDERFELQWGRGLAAAEMHGPAGSRKRKGMSFNGAAALRPRKSDVHGSMSGKNNGLQWGRGLAAAEILACAVAGSNGVKLQWGRGLAAAEIGPGSRVGDPQGGRLQWGRGLAAVEIGR